MKYRLSTSEIYALGVIAFLIDHAGLYFFTDNLWLRVFRLFAIVWFLPCGYNSGWRARWHVWAGLGLLMLMDAMTGVDIMPLSALATIIATRIFIDPVMEIAMKSRANFIATMAALTLLIIPTAKAMEYGTLGLMFAAVGWLVRHKGIYDEKIVELRPFAYYVVTCYLIFTQNVFHFTSTQFMVVMFSTVVAMEVHFDYRKMILEDLHRRPKDWVAKTCRWIGHNSLGLYVLHLVLFRLLFII
jgi:hypothetical protein